MGVQATQNWDGKTLYRWYVYETNGHRRVTWAESAEAALAKARRKLDVTDRVDPAPALLDA